MNSADILIIRTSAMGDVVMASHLVEGLRRRYPDARITWLAEPQVAPLLENHPALDSVLVWPKMRWKELLRTLCIRVLYKEVSSFVRALRGQKFTMAIDAQGLLRTRLLAWLSGARQRVGFDSREPGRFLMTQIVAKGGDKEQMGSEYFYLLGQLGVETGGLCQSISLAPASLAEASDVLASAGVKGIYAVFAPFTTRPQKHWVREQWIQLGREVTRNLSLPVVWLGGADDREAAQSLAAEGGGVSLAGKTSLAVSAAVVSKAALLVGVDTGLTHLGTAFRIPTVALFGSTCPYTRSCSPKTVVLYHPLSCSPCRRTPVCNGSYDCMLGITACEVMQVISQYQLQGAKPTHENSAS